MNKSSPPQECRSLFLIWGTPDQGPRSQVLANKLGMQAWYISTGLPRGPLYIPIKYPLQAVRTFRVLFSHQPGVIFVQNPPVLAVFCAYLYCLRKHAGFIIDAHSEALLAKGWTAPPAWFKKFLARKAIATIVTNEHLAQTIKDFGGQTIILRDIPTTFPVHQGYPVSSHFNIAVINTFAADEPLKNILEAAGSVTGVEFYVTGRVKQSDARILSLVQSAPSNVHFTDFLPVDDYYSLLNSVNSVMCLTSRDHTMQRGACEALSLGKPIITSDWTLLRQYFNQGTVHVDNTVEGIRLGILSMQENYPDYAKGIVDLQNDQQTEWEQKKRALERMIQSFSMSRQASPKRVKAG
jgi:glycosyltransferase involved in cell wall biosynthesis